MVFRGVVVIVALALASTPTLAQVAAPRNEPPPKLTFAQIGLFIYPAKAQAAEQQQKDEQACYEWGEVNTGLTLVAGNVDAQAAVKAAAKDAGQGRVVGGAAAGAATGLAIGAIAGDAGKGAPSEQLPVPSAGSEVESTPSSRPVRKAHSRPCRPINSQWNSSRTPPVRAWRVEATR